jgi:hypothetical protein
VSTATDDFSRRIASAVTPLNSILRDHLEYFGELLPHVLFGDIARWTQEALGTAPRSPWVSRLIELLDSGYADEGDDVRELIVVSFLENLFDEPALAAVLGPHLQPVYQEISEGAAD